MLRKAVWCYKMCEEIPRGYSRKTENVKVLTNSGKQRGQDQNDKNTTLKTKKQMNIMDPTKKLGVDPVLQKSKQSLLPAGHPPCSSFQITLDIYFFMGSAFPISNSGILIV